MLGRKSTSERPRPRQNLGHDGLYIGKRQIGRWGLRKYEILGYYCEIFSKGMQYKWPDRVYIDALCGCGRGKIRKTDNIVETSPFMALRVAIPFSHYIFCDKDEKAINALRQRVDTEFANELNVQYVIGDVNECYPKIIKYIPPNSLKLCFLDPYDIGVHFRTVEKLAEVGKIDFLTLLALHVDAKRNVAHYEHPNTNKVENFLGMPDWRESWKKYKKEPGATFVRFLAEMYAESMVDIGYKELPIDRMVPVASKVDLYYLALFSRSERAYYYWDQTLKYATGQRSFHFMH